MSLFVEHPYLFYLLLVMVCGAWMHARITPEQMRIHAKNYQKAADLIEKTQRELPAEWLWPVGMYLLGFMWPVALGYYVYGSLQTLLFGAQDVTFKE
jgi:hypothetical protein